MTDIYIAKDTKKLQNRPQKSLPRQEDVPPTSDIKDSPTILKIESELAQEIGKIDSNGQPKISHRFFSGFSFFPPRINFETQSHEEKIVLLLRRHPITNIPWIIMALLLLIAPSLLRYFSLPSFIPSNYTILGVMVWYLLTLAFIFENFLTWYFNVDIVTDERIVDVEFANLIYKDISDAKIDDIQEVQVIVGGVLRTIVNFGSVFIQTAAEKPNFEFRDVPNPEQVSKIIDKLRILEEEEQIAGRAR